MSSFIYLCLYIDVDMYPYNTYVVFLACVGVRGKEIASSHARARQTPASCLQAKLVEPGRAHRATLTCPAPPNRAGRWWHSGQQLSGASSALHLQHQQPYAPHLGAALLPSRRE